VEPIRRALWYIESHFASPIGLDDIAEASGLSRFHFSRTFTQTTGLSVSSYLRGRRLSQAAHVLAEGAPDILTVALDVGYGSHEAFTRAFRDFFGVTPEEVRAKRDIANLELMEPFTMKEQPATRLPEPLFREEGPFLMAGIREFRTFCERAGIPGQWQRPHIGHMPGQIGSDAYGICLAPSSGEEGFDYLTAVAVRSLDELPEGLSGLRISRRRYAIFHHGDHISKIGATCAAIFGEWQPKSGQEIEKQPLFLIEHYGSEFEPLICGKGITPLGKGGLSSQGLARLATAKPS
jgi:AraC family transcriptional regulator